MTKNNVPLIINATKRQQPRLGVPALDPHRKPQPYLRVKSLQTWATELPIGNTAVAAHQFLHQVRSLNSAYYSPKERLALLHILRPTLLPLLSALKQPLRQAGLPLDDKQQYTVDLLQTLLEQMAIGYKLIVHELAGKEPAKLKEEERGLLTQACYLGITYLSQELIEAYGVYGPAPARLWLELNQLYQFAEARQFHLHAVDEPYPDTPLPVQHNIDFAYKRIVLLTLAEPYHLMEDEVEDMYRLIAPSAPLCVITAMNLHIPEGGAYVIDFDTDIGPRYIAANAAWKAGDGRLIDIKNVKTQLDTHLQRILRANLQSPVLDSTKMVERQYRDMLLRLADAWNGSLQRRNQRFPLEGKVQLTSGLNACHYFISGEAEFTPAMDELKLVTYEDIRQQGEQHSVFATAYRQALQRDRRHISRNYFLNPWSHQNVSPIGIALNNHEAAEHLHAQVGELVAYRFSYKRSQRWRIGVIRWLQSQLRKRDKNDQIHLGILNLATGAVPVGLKGITGVGSGTDYFRGLFVPRQVALDQKRSLIVPALMYDVNSMLAINMKRRLFHVRLTHARLSTRSFSQFDFEVVSKPHYISE
jgi:cyclic-di-GMP-binding protein